MITFIRNENFDNGSERTWAQAEKKDDIEFLYSRGYKGFTNYGVHHFYKDCPQSDNETETLKELVRLNTLLGD